MGSGRSSRAGRIAIAGLAIALARGLPADEPVPPDAAAGASATAEEFERVENLNRNLTVIHSRSDLVSEFTECTGIRGWDPGPRGSSAL